jgi:hypothetical protein
MADVSEVSSRAISLARARISAGLSAHPAAVQHYPRVVENLAEAIEARAPDGEMARAIRELVESVN